MGNRPTVKVVEVNEGALRALCDMVYLAAGIATRIQGGLQVGTPDTEAMYKLADSLKGGFGMQEEPLMPVRAVPVAGPEPRPVLPAPEEMELHIYGNPEMPKRFGAKVKALGGSYSACRGYESTRFVYLPLTTEGFALAEELVAAYPDAGQTTVIFRGKARTADAVQDVKRDCGDSVACAYARYEGDVWRSINAGFYNKW